MNAPEAVGSNSDDYRVTMRDLLEKVREESDKARVELGKQTKTQKEMKESQTTEVDRLCTDHVKEVAARWAPALEG